MAQRIDGYWMDVYAPGNFFLEQLTIPPLPPGTNVFASISLSEVNTLFDRNDPNPKFSTSAHVDSYTTYLPDGSISPPQAAPLSTLQNGIFIENCATITFGLSGTRVAATAQVTIFSF